jgi:hypothetical protein
MQRLKKRLAANAECSGWKYSQVKAFNLFNLAPAETVDVFKDYFSIRDR